MSALQSIDCQNYEWASSESLPKEDPLDKLAFTGFFNGFNIELRAPEDIQLHKLGWFGRLTGSQLRPTAHKKCAIMRKRQFLKRNEWYMKFSEAKVKSKPDSFLQAVDKLTAKILNEGEKYKNKDLVDLVSSDGSSNSDDDDDCEYVEFIKDASEFKETNNIAVVVPNSDSEPDDNNSNYFENMKAECCVNKTKLQEKIIFSLQEAFFLMYAYGCLQVVDLDGRSLNIQQVWELFTKTDKRFLNKYVVYHYFRSRGYIVKPGLKFGGDYLLYKCSPEVSHSDYIVVIKFNNSETDWISTLGHVRMANTTVKEIIIAEVITPEVPAVMPEGLEKFTVKTTILSRNIGSINVDE